MTTNPEVRSLQPATLWNYFADINAIPRASKKEQRIVAFMEAFGKSLCLPTLVDDAGNVIIRKPASQGMENRQTVVLQSHLDMVHQKNSDSDFDFDTQGIDMCVESDWVCAKGTTLGADNGIGAATIMAILASTDIPHPAIEALFTVDEETGMTGAFALKGGLLSGSILLNLDTEADNELTIGCAGGLDITATGSYPQQAPQNGQTAFTIAVKGLTGGHSGGDIHLGRGNANKIMNRILTELDRRCGIGVASVSGGSLRNAIPRESVATVTVGQPEQLKKEVAALAVTLAGEYNVTDPALEITCVPAATPSSIMDSAFQNNFLRSVYACPNGIYRMSPGIAGLVQSSNNLARVVAENGGYSLQCLTRSSVDSEKYDLANAITASFELMGASVSQGNAYPGWQPLPDSPIVRLMDSLYLEMFNEHAHVNAVHAGLECGILGTNYPEMQMISFGPNITGAHSPDERVQISSVQKFWRYLLETLKRIPDA